MLYRSFSMLNLIKYISLNFINSLHAKYEPYYEPIIKAEIFYNQCRHICISVVIIVERRDLSGIRIVIITKKTFI